MKQWKLRWIKLCKFSRTISQRKNYIHATKTFGTWISLNSQFKTTLKAAKYRDSSHDYKRYLQQILRATTISYAPVRNHFKARPQGFTIGRPAKNPHAHTPEHPSTLPPISEIFNNSKPNTILDNIVRNLWHSILKLSLN